MKKIAYILPILFLASCFAKRKPEIPVFNLLLKDSVTIFNTGNIPEGKPSVLLFFSPDCEHCQQETIDLLANMDSLKNVNFYFVTVDPMDRMRRFDTFYKLYRYPNITLGRDYTVSFPGHFKNVAPPYSVIYNPDKTMRVIFEGETPVSRFIKATHKTD
jgi:thiol-disulfide isomerase/thioredoxin